MYKGKTRRKTLPKKEEQHREPAEPTIPEHIKHFMDPKIVTQLTSAIANGEPVVKMELKMVKRIFRLNEKKNARENVDLKWEKDRRQYFRLHGLDYNKFSATARNRPLSALPVQTKMQDDNLTRNQLKRPRKQNESNSADIDTDCPLPVQTEMPKKWTRKQHKRQQKHERLSECRKMNQLNREGQMQKKLRKTLKLKIKKDNQEQTSPGNTMQETTEAQEKKSKRAKKRMKWNEKTNKKLKTIQTNQD